MKKQLLIAAVAATMASASMADISIKGSANVKWMGNDAGASEMKNNMDIDVTGKAGSTAVHAHLDVDDAKNNTIVVDKLYMTTSVGGINVKAGDWSSCTGMVEGIKACSTTDDAIALSTTVGGFTVAASGSGDTATVGTYVVKGKIGGMDVALREDRDTSTNIAVKGDISGVGFYLENMNRDAADSDATLIAAHTSVAGGTLSVASYEADATGSSLNTGDIRPLGTSLVGDFHTAVAGSLAGVEDIKGIGFNTDVQGNNVNITHFDYDTAAATDMNGTDIVVTRDLASGATLTANYGTMDTSKTTDVTVYGAKLSVKF